MYEITNPSKGPLQLMVRSRRGPSPSQFTVLNMCGIGAGKNTYLLEDELMTDDIWRKHSDKLVEVRYIDENSLTEGAK